jgi:hypothetical protein
MPLIPLLWHDRQQPESHTEFVTYTIFGEGVAERPFDAATLAFS